MENEFEGHWKEVGYTSLVREVEDENYLIQIFQSNESEKFTLSIRSKKENSIYIKENFNSITKAMEHARLAIEKNDGKNKKR